MIDAQQALQQLAQSPNAIGRLSATIGAKNFMHSNEDSFVSFKFMRGAKNKANYLKITLNAMDTYDLEFGKIHGLNYSVKKSIQGVYDDMLKNIFETETGLYLSL